MLNYDRVPRLPRERDRRPGPGGLETDDFLIAGAFAALGPSPVKPCEARRRLERLFRLSDWSFQQALNRLVAAHYLKRVPLDSRGRSNNYVFIGRVEVV